jgi:hypothetical protein
VLNLSSFKGRADLPVHHLRGGAVSRTTGKTVTRKAVDPNQPATAPKLIHYQWHRDDGSSWDHITLAPDTTAILIPNHEATNGKAESVFNQLTVFRRDDSLERTRIAPTAVINNTIPGPPSGTECVP